MNLDATTIAALAALVLATSALWLAGVEQRLPHPDISRVTTNFSLVLSKGLSILADILVVLLILSRDGIPMAAAFAILAACALLGHRLPATGLTSLYSLRVPMAFAALLLSIYAWGRALSA